MCHREVRRKVAKWTVIPLLGVVKVSDRKMGKNAGGGEGSAVMELKEHENFKERSLGSGYGYSVLQLRKLVEFIGKFSRSVKDYDPRCLQFLL